MSGTQLIEGVTAGRGSAVGAFAVENLAQGVAALGFLALSTGSAICTDGDQPARNLQLDLSAASLWENRLDIGTGPRPVLALGLHQTQHSGASIANVTDGLFPTPLPTADFGHVRISDPSTGRAVVFDLSDVADDPPVKRLNFGGADVVPLTGVVDTQFGSAAIEAPISINGVGWDSAFVGLSSASRGASGRAVLFDLLQAAPQGLPAHLTISGPRVLGVVGFDSFNAAAAALENLSQGLFPSSVFGTVPHPAISGDSSGRWISLDLADQPYGTQPVQLNISGPLVARSSGSDLTDFGVAALLNESQGVFPSAVKGVVPAPSVSVDTVARWVVFDLATVRSANALNVTLEWGIDNRSARFDVGLDSFSAGTTIVENQPVIEPVGVQTTRFGTEIGYKWLVYAGGSDFTLFGNSGPHFPGYVMPHGFDSCKLGNPDVPQNVFSGLLATLWGQADAEQAQPPEDQTLLAISEESLDEWGADTWLSNSIRFLDFNQFGFSGSVGADVRASWSPQYAYLPFDNLFFRAGFYSIGFGIEIQPATLRSTVFGVLGIDYVRLAPDSIDQTTAGLPSISNAAIAIGFASGLDSLRTGDWAQIRTDLIIEFEHDCSSVTQLCGAAPSLFSRIWNRNLVVRPNAFDSLSIKYHVAAIRRGGDALLMRGFESHKYSEYWQGLHLVAFAVRSYTVGGVDSFYSSPWSVVRNNARLLQPAGINSLSAGTPDLERLLTQVRMWGTNHLQVPDVQWVSRSPRYVSVGTGYRSPQLPPVAQVSLASRPVVFGGFSTFSWSLFGVVGKPVPQIKPSWMPMDIQDPLQIGFAKVWNRNFEAAMRGFELTIWPPRPFGIWHNPRPVDTAGSDTSVFGRHQIADSTQHVAILPVQSGVRFSIGAFVWEDPPPAGLPFWQSIVFNGFSGTVIPDDEYPYDWGIYERSALFEGFDSFGAGQAVVSRMGVVFGEGVGDSWKGSTEFGTATCYGGAQYVAPSVFEFATTTVPSGSPGEVHYPKGTTKMPKFSISPLTIWCTHDTPSQAVENHRVPNHPSVWCDVDAFCYPAAHPFWPYSAGSDREGPWFGRAVFGPFTEYVGFSSSGDPNHVRNRCFFVAGDFTTAYGTPRIQPEPWDSFVGWFPTIMGGGARTVRAYSGDEPESQFGEAALHDTGPRYLDVVPTDMFSSGVNTVQNWVRQLSAEGFEATIYGDSTPPMVYYYPRGPVMQGAELFEVGTAWASYHTRLLPVEGFDAFLASWTEFPIRMVVDRSLEYVFVYRYNIFSEFGSTYVSVGDARIGPYGIAPTCASPGVSISHG